MADAWLARGSITDGAMFRRLKVGLATPAPTSDRAAARVLQARAAMAGFDPARFAGHSLRAGLRHGRRSRRGQRVQAEEDQPTPQHQRARILPPRRSPIRGPRWRGVPVRDPPGVLPRMGAFLSCSATMPECHMTQWPKYALT